MKKYFYVIKTQIIKRLTYAFDVYGNLLVQTIIMITSAFFWKALYKDGGTVGGVDVNSMMVYITMSSVLSVLFITNVEKRIEQSVQKGTVATDMMKPVNLFGVYFAEDIGTVIALILQNILPILLIGSIFIGIPKMEDVRDLPLFVLSVILSFFINWFLAAIFGMMAFSAVSIDALIQVKKHLIRLISGSIIPLWFFPEGLANVLKVLPFPYIYQLPLSIYIGRGTRAEIFTQMEISLAWAVILFLIFMFAQKRITGKVMVQGG